jgi:phosphohistidine phosphatase
MRRLLLLRHGKADRHSAGGDRERPLTKRGEEDSRRMGEYLATEGLTPDLAVASNARRAKRTLDLALESFPNHVTHLIENTIYLATADHLLEILRQTPDKFFTLLAVGHNPGFAEFAISLAGSGKAEDLSRLRSKFPTAALAVLDFEAEHWVSVGHGDGRLAYFITPAGLRGDVLDDPD